MDFAEGFGGRSPRRLPNDQPGDFPRQAEKPDQLRLAASAPSSPRRRLDVHSNVLNYTASRSGQSSRSVGPKPKPVQLGFDRRRRLNMPSPAATRSPIDAGSGTFVRLMPFDTMSEEANGPVWLAASEADSLR